MARRRQGVGVGWRDVGGGVARRVGWLGFKPWLHICYGEVRKARQRWEGASATARKGDGEGEALARGFVAQRLGLRGGAPASVPLI